MNILTKIIYVFSPLLLSVAMIIFSVALILEIGGRFYIRKRTSDLPVNFMALQLEHMHQYDPDTLWSLKKNVENNTPYLISTNNLGLRGPELRPRGSQIRILTLGDSRTFGDGSSNEETWQALLENKFDGLQPGYVEVINAGVCGWSAFQGLRYLETRGLALDPDIVVACFGINDWAPMTTNEIALVDWEDLTHYWGIEALLRNAIKGADKILHRPPFGPREYRMSPGEFTDSHVRMHRLCEEQKIRFDILFLPTVSDIPQRPYVPPVCHLVMGVAFYLGQNILDPTSYFPDEAAEFYVDPIHFSPAGNEIIADYLFENLEPERQIRLSRLSKRERVSDLATQMFEFGLQCEQENKPVEACDLYRKVLGMKPDHVQALYRAGTLELQQELIGEGIKKIKRAAALENALSHEMANHLGEIAAGFAEQEKTDTAIDIFQTAIELFPENIWLQISVGRLLELKGRDSEAVSLYKKALTVAPDSPVVAEMLDELFDKQKDVEGAIEFWSSILQANPQSIVPLLFVGIAWERKSRYAEAAQSYLSVLQRNPDSSQALYRLGCLEIQQGLMDDGIRRIKHAAMLEESLKGDISKCLMKLAEDYSEQNKIDTAIVLHQTALEISPTDLWPQVYLGELYEKQGNSEAALAAYRSVLLSKPESPVAAQKMDTLLGTMAVSPEVMLEEWESIVEKHPNAEAPLKYLKKTRALAYGSETSSNE